MGHGIYSDTTMSPTISCTHDWPWPWHCQMDAIGTITKRSDSAHSWTHSGVNKIANILQLFFKCVFLVDNFGLWFSGQFWSMILILLKLIWEQLIIKQWLNIHKLHSAHMKVSHYGKTYSVIPVMYYQIFSDEILSFFSETEVCWI